MTGDADDSVAPDHFARLVITRIVLPDVNAVTAELCGQIGPIVQDECRTGALRDRHQAFDGAANVIVACGEPNNHCSESSTAWDGSTTVALLRFDLSPICPGSIVQTAQLELTTTDDNLGSNGTVAVYMMLEDWDEGGGNIGGNTGFANWTERKSGVAWSGPGASPPSREAQPIHTFLPTDTNHQYKEALPPASIQKWVTTPSSNFGLAVLVINGDSDVSFSTREGSDKTAPGLVIESIAP